MRPLRFAVPLLLFAACAKPADPLPAMDAFRVVRTLVDPELWTCEEGSPQQIAGDIYEPRAISEVSEGRPGLKLSTPSVWSCEIPASPAGSTLEFAMCVAPGNYRKEGQVTIEFEWNGDLLQREVLSCSKDVPREERRWRPASCALPAERGRLVVRSSYEGTHPRGPEIAIGTLEVREPLEVQRTRAVRGQPNVVFVVLDTLRADRMECYGHTRANTPNLAALAAEGALFEQAFSSAPWTSPGTASLLTSLSVPEHDVGGSSLTLPHELLSVAETFQQAGWTTAGLSCNPIVSSSRHFDQGFEFFWEHRWSQSETVMPDVLGWLDEYGEYRFFLYLHLVDPHDPYEPAEPFQQEYVGPMPDGYSGETGKGLMDRVFNGDYDVEFLERVARYNLDRYDGEIASVDRELGRLFEHLAAAGLADNTLVCVTSDHGEEFMEHGMLGHVKQLHRESVHVPLLLRGPGVPAGVSIAHPVENRFVAPTLLRLCGIEAPDALAGAFLLETAAASPVYFATAYGRYFETDANAWSDARPLFGVTAGRWSYFRFPPTPKARSAVEQLFDLELDPDALRDVAAEHEDELRTLRAEIERWRLSDGARADGELQGEADQELLRSLGYIDGR